CAPHLRRRHARACPGHPRLYNQKQERTWMAGSSPAMTESISTCLCANDALMTPRTATLIGLTAILMWSLLTVLTVATGRIPAFQLAAMTFAIGALVAFASFLFRPSAFNTLKQPLVAWVVGVGGLFGYHALYFLA